MQSMSGSNRNIILSQWQNSNKYNVNGTNQLTTYQKTYVGIDFGTSTTVASVIYKEPGGSWHPRPLQIAQPSPKGGSIEDEIVNTVLAWRNDRLYFGLPAYKIKRASKGVGKTIFSSFKMGLGIDLGPNYPRTALSRKQGSPKIIESSKDATREFFALLIPEIEKAVQSLGLPTTIEYAISVPASFQANQRKDLREALDSAGVKITDDCFIDEPNAAFLSYLFESSQEKEALSLNEVIEEKPQNIIVYDFGAGTCDVSILEVSIQKDSEGRKLRSKNRAISRFTALGGDDIDREISRRVLLKQLKGLKESENLTHRDLEEIIIPKLMPVAEELKIAFTQWMESQGIHSLNQLKQNGEYSITSGTPISIKCGETHFQNLTPTMTSNEFKDVMEQFAGYFEEGDLNKFHVYGPVQDALDKAKLADDEIYGIIFIGGSSENPLVRKTIMDQFPDSVKEIVPRNLRAHVSQGAALHSAAFNGFGQDLIVPVTSEPITYITRDNDQRTLIKASTPVPTGEIVVQAKIAENAQRELEIPICLGSKDHLIGILRLSGGLAGFSRDSIVTITSKITHEKLLQVEAECEGVKISHEIVNPLSYQKGSKLENEYLKALKRYNECYINNKENIPLSIIEDLCKACEKTQRYEEAGDYNLLIDKRFHQDRATNIGYFYARAGQPKKSIYWGEEAYRREPTALTAYNLSCNDSMPQKERIDWLRKSLSFDPDFAYALYQLGKILFNKGDPEGKILLDKAVSRFHFLMKQGFLDLQKIQMFYKAIELTGRTDLLEEVKKYEKSLIKEKEREDGKLEYEQESLAVPLNSRALVER